MTVQEAPRISTVDNAQETSQIDLKLRLYFFYIEVLLGPGVEGQEHLTTAAKHFENGGSLVLVSNHESMLDSILITRVMREALDWGMCDMIWPASSKFYPDLYNRLPEEQQVKLAADIARHRENVLQDEVSMMGAVTQRYGMHLVPIVQTSVLEDKEYSEAFRRESALISKKGLEHMAEVLGAGSAVAGIFSEGTRSPIGKLLEAEPGLGRIFREKATAEKTLIVPVGLTGTGKAFPIGAKRPNFRAHVSLSFGEPFTYAQATREANLYKVHFKDIVMMHVATQLPTDKHGFYAQRQFASIIDLLSVRFVDE